jgi:hypothetical protein
VKPVDLWKRRGAELLLSVLVLIVGLMGQRVCASGVHISGVDPGTAYWGETVRIYGVGGTPGGLVMAMLNRSDTPVYMVNGTVAMINDSPNVTLGWTNVQSSGDWEIFFAAPFAAPKTYAIFVFDNESLTSDAATLSILTRPIAPFVIDSFTPDSGKPGTRVQIYGFGCCYNGLRVYFNDALVAELTGGVYEGWNTTFTVPSVLSGNYTVTLVDVLSGGNLTRQFQVQLLPVLHLSPASGAVGDRLTISGEGFLPNETLYITFEDLDLAATYANGSGAFNVTVFVPMVDSGIYTVKAKYQVNASSEPLTLATAQLSVTEGVDTFNHRIQDVNSTLTQELSSALNQLQSDTQSLSSVQDTARWAELFALIAITLSGGAVIILITTLLRRRQASTSDQTQAQPRN